MLGREQGVPDGGHSGLPATVAVPSGTQPRMHHCSASVKEVNRYGPPAPTKKGNAAIHAFRPTRYGQAPSGRTVPA